MDPALLRIRDVRPLDQEPLDALILRAFEQDAEAPLINELRQHAKTRFNLVAEYEDALLGSILLVDVRIEDGQMERASVGIGLVAVHPNHRRQGVGTMLLKEGLLRCIDAGEPVVFALTDPGFYMKFGFSLASARGFHYKWEEFDNLLLVKELVPDGMQGLSGTVDFSPEILEEI